MWQRKPITEHKFDRLADQLRRKVQAQSKQRGLTADTVRMLRTEYLPSVLLPYQLSWVMDEHQFKVIEKSRRVGISFSNALDDVIFAASVDGADCEYMSYKESVTKEYIKDCKFWAKEILGCSCVCEEIVDDESKDFLSFSMKFASGFSITAMSSNPDNPRGKGRPRSRITIDEAGATKNLNDVIDAAAPFLAWGGSVRIIGTHKGDRSDFFDLIKDIRSKKRLGVVHRITLAEAVQAGLYKKRCAVLGVEWTAEGEKEWVKLLYSTCSNPEEEYGVIPSSGTGTALSRAVIERCMSDAVPVIRLQRDDDFKLKPEIWRQTDIEDWLADNLLPLLEALPKDRRCYLGYDFARSGDLSTLQVLQDGKKCALDTVLLLETRNIPHTSQYQIARYVIENLPMFSHAAFDARGNGNYLAEVIQQRFGAHRVTTVMLSEKWYREEMPPYIAHIEDGTITLPLDVGVLDDHRLLVKVNGVIRVPDKKTKDEKDGGYRHGDSAIAGALACFSSRQAVCGPVEYHSVQPRRSSGGGWQRRK